MREKLKKFKVQIILFTLIGLSIAGMIYLLGHFSIRTEDIEFYPSESTDWDEKDTSLKLHGRFYYPINFIPLEKYPSIVMFHGKGGDLEDNDYLARTLASMGIVIFSIEFRGHGDSEGDFDDVKENTNITFGDALGAYRYLKKQSFIDEDKLLAQGTSMGGAASVFLALQSKPPVFITWYPALSYISGNTPLYEYNATDSDFEGLIIAGSKDTCESCLPEFDEEFVDNNPSVNMELLIGAEHTDSRYFLECVDITVEWISDLWDLEPASWFINIYQNGILAGILMAVVIIIDVSWIIKKLNLTMKQKEKKS